MEHAIGSMVGSQALKTKGMQKEQEAQAFKHQSAELAEAEKLEREALLRRERAVQHGKFPPYSVQIIALMMADFDRCPSKQ